MSTSAASSSTTHRQTIYEEAETSKERAQQLALQVYTNPVPILYREVGNLMADPLEYVKTMLRCHAFIREFALLLSSDQLPELDPQNEDWRDYAEHLVVVLSAVTVDTMEKASQALDLFRSKYAEKLEQIDFPKDALAMPPAEFAAQLITKIDNTASNLETTDRALLEQCNSIEEVISKVIPEITKRIQNPASFEEQELAPIAHEEEAVFTLASKTIHLVQTLLLASVVRVNQLQKQL